MTESIKFSDTLKLFHKLYKNSKIISHQDKLFGDIETKTKVLGVVNVVQMSTKIEQISV